jgi:hypothetical protein
MLRRIVLTAMALGLMLGLTSTPRTDGHAHTNEGYAVIILNPSAELPKGWTYDN